jgi:hypothetical protein
LNAVLFAVETDSKRFSSHSTFIDIDTVVLTIQITDFIFLLIFLVELILRYQAEGREAFMKQAWSWFDFLVVALGFVEFVASLFFVLVADQGDGDGVIGRSKGVAPDPDDYEGTVGTYVRMLVFMRLLRLLRIVRLVNLFRELQVLLKGIKHASRALLWISLMMLILILACAIYTTRVLGHNDKILTYASVGDCHDGEREVFTKPLAGIRPPSEEEVLSFDPESPKMACNIVVWFGTVPRSMFSLFMTTTGEGWPQMARQIMDPKSGASSYVVGFFLLYIFFTSITLMNLITGVIVENVMMISHEDEVANEKRERQQRRAMAMNLHDIFLISDKTGDFQLSRQEYDTMLQDPHVLRLLRSMGILPDDIRDLFDIMDVDGSGQMDIKEFFDVFKNFKGTAMSKNLLELHLQFSTEMDKDLKVIQRSKERGDKARRYVLKRTKKGLKEVMNNFAVKGPLALSNQALPMPPPPPPAFEPAITKSGSIADGTTHVEQLSANGVRNRTSSGLKKSRGSRVDEARVLREAEHLDQGTARALGRLEGLWSSTEELFHHKMTEAERKGDRSAEDLWTADSSSEDAEVPVIVAPVITDEADAAMDEFVDV